MQESDLFGPKMAFLTDVSHYDVVESLLNALIYLPVAHNPLLDTISSDVNNVNTRLNQLYDKYRTHESKFYQFMKTNYFLCEIFRIYLHVCLNFKFL